jgi:outer membrane receptor for ferrienterochelin and colicin
MTLRKALACALIAFSIATTHGPGGGLARADNLADEAELQFEIGAERYNAGDVRGALEHFLASNRLAPNRNVVFNIARAYEHLGQNADAYRYYNQALAGEQDPVAQGRIAEAIARIEPLVAVLQVDSDPPGATIFIARRDLGARGNTPVTMGLAPGTYVVFADSPGYESAETGPQELKAGTRTHLTLRLQPIVGTLRVEGGPAGAEVRLDDDGGPVACTIPCLALAPPGRHTLFVSTVGYVSKSTSVTVVAGATEAARVELDPLTGTLLVASEVRNALVTVDGRERGLTPAALALPIGVHDVTVTHPGFRPAEQRIEVTADSQAHIDADLIPIEEVTAASRLTEMVEDAPSSVSIITGRELKAMAYPTIAEAVRGVRGVFLTDDTSYETVGFRGFSTPGGYGARVLVLVDGQPTNDDYVGSSYVGYDARADIDDIQRIEIIRGPGSALYGTGAFFGVINLVTRDRDAPTHGEVAVSTADNGVGHARATAQLRFSEDSGAWSSVAVARGAGRDYFFQEYASDPATGGNARGLDGFQTETVNGRVWFKALTLQWLLTSRDKTLPSGEFETIFGDPRTHFIDTRGLLELRFEPTISKHIQLLSRAHLDLYDFDDFLAYGSTEGGAAHETFRGRWMGVEQRVVLTPGPALRVTAGGEVQRHFETAQTGQNDSGFYLSRNDPYSVLAGYLVGDVTPARALKLSVGSRLDYYSNFGSSLSPRAAVIVRPYEAGNLKIVVGKAFRAPSVYEHYYTGPTQIPGLSLRPEQIVSGEVEFTHRFSSAFSATVATYTNYVTNLIVLDGDGTAQSPNQYVNSTSPIETTGAEAEVRREWRDGWMVGASYAYQRSHYLNDALVGGVPPLRDVPNSPNHLASLKAAAPVVGSLLNAMTRLSFVGPRRDKYDQSTDPPQGTTPSALLWDVVLSGQAERYRLRYALGLYNATNYRYTVPVSREFQQESIVQSGRTALLSAQVTF